MAGFSVGDRVRHSLWGKGVVIRAYHQGMEYGIRFDNGLSFRLPRTGLKLLPPEPVPEPPPRLSTETFLMLLESALALQKQPKGKAVESPRARARKPRKPPVPPPAPRQARITPAPFLPAHVCDRNVLEAFRLGIVPRHAIRDWTFGRDPELRTLTEWLKDLSEGALILEGAYGSGKTHLLEYLAHHALGLGYAASVVRLDPGQGNAAFPWRLYGEILRHVRALVNGREADLREVLEGAADKLGTMPWLTRHPLLGSFFTALAAGALTEEDWQAFGGGSVAGPHFSFNCDFTTVGNILCNTLSCLGSALVHGADMNGLIVLLDETETAKTYLYNYHWTRSLNLLRALTLTANDEPDLLEESVEKVNGFYTGTRTGLVYAGHYRNIRYAERIPSFLKVVVAITPGSFSPKFKEWRSSVPQLELDRVGRSSLSGLFHAVNEKYRTVYGTALTPAEEKHCLALLEDRYPDRSTRGLIKGVVELLDFRRFYPEAPLQEAVERPPFAAAFR